MGQGYLVYQSDVVLDAVAPAALWNIGLRSNLFSRRLLLSGFAYNVLNARTYAPDGLYELSPRDNLLPIPREGFSFFLRATWRN